MKNRYTDEFMAFWLKYPGRWNESSGAYIKQGKYEAAKEWDNLNKTEKVQAMFAVTKICKGKYILDACRWLKRKMFDDFDMPKNWIPVLPKEFTKEIGKSIEYPGVDINNARNEALKKLQG